MTCIEDWDDQGSEFVVFVRFSLKSPLFAPCKWLYNLFVWNVADMSLMEFLFLVILDEM